MAKMPSCLCTNTIRLRAGRRHDGRADRRTSGQRRVPRLSPGRFRAGRARRTRACTKAQARSIFYARRRSAASGPVGSTPTSNGSHRPTGSSKPSSSRRTRSGRSSRASTPCAAPGSIVSSNTSGLSIAGLAEGRSDDFRRHWLGTHFFNPASIPAAARDHSDGRHRSGRRRGRARLRRSPARKERRHREGHARDSSPITSPCTASCGFSKRSPPAPTPLKR